MEICVPCYPPIANNRHDWIARGNFTARAQFDLLLSLEEYRRVHGHAINGDMSLVLNKCTAGLEVWRIYLRVCSCNNR